MCRCRHFLQNRVASVPGAGGKGKNRLDYKKNLLPTGVTPQHYDLSLDTNLRGDFKYNGHVDISVNVEEEGLKTISIHSIQIEIKKATLNKRECAKFEMDEAEEIVTFFFEKEIPVGDAILSIDFVAVHNDQLNGFYRAPYKDANGETKIMATTQFEATDARRCFPCFDEPAAKATFALTIIIDKDLTAISNMPESGQKQLPNNRKEVKFLTSPKMSTYLLAFCVGEFEYLEHKDTTKYGTKLRVYGTPGKVEEARFALDVGIRALNLYDELFGLPFPLPKMDMIAVPQHSAGAMENWGLVTYREVDLCLGKFASTAHKQRVAVVVAHELAHQWFGNLVTMKWWDDLWLNEGFASWMENYCLSVLFPEWRMWDQFVVGAQAIAKRLDGRATSHPVQVPIPNSRRVEEIFDGISYCKGACVVQTVYTYMGHQDFFKGLQVYMDRFQYTNAETKDLCNAWGEVHGTGSEIANLVECWTGQMGYPIMDVNTIASSNGIEVNFKQEWFLEDGTEGDDRSWILPNLVTDLTQSKKLNPIKEKKGKFLIEDTSTEVLKLNHNQAVMLVVNYSVAHWKKIIASLSEDFGSLSPVDKAGLLLDARSLVTSKRLDPVIFLELLTTFKQARSYVAVDALVIGVSTLIAYLDGEIKDRAKRMASTLLVEQFKAIGWEKQENEEHLTSMLRGILFASINLIAGEDTEVLKEAQSRFDAYTAAPNSDEGRQALPSGYRGGIFKLLLRQKNDKAIANFEKLMEIEPTIDNAGDKNTILTSLGSVSSREKKIEVLDWTTKTVKLQDFFYGIAGVSNSGDEGRDLTWEYMKEHYDRIFERIGSAHLHIVEAVVVVSSRGFKTEEKAKEIEEFYKSKNCRAFDCVHKIVEATKTTARKLKDNVFNNAQVSKFLEAY